MDIKNQRLFSLNWFYVALLLGLIGYILVAFHDRWSENVYIFFTTLLPIYAGYFILVLRSLKNNKYKKPELVIVLIISIFIRALIIPSNPINVESYIFHTIAGKTILFFFETITIIILLKLLDHFSMNRMRITLFILNPVVILETYNNGHPMIITICFLVLSVYLFYKNKEWISVITSAIAAVIQYLLLLSLLPFIYKKLLKKLTLMLIIILPSFYIFYITKPLSDITSILLVSYTDSNGFIFKVLVYIFNLFSKNINEQIKFLSLIFDKTEFTVSILLITVSIFIVIDQMKKLKLTANFKGINYLHTGFIITSGILLLLPSLNPWDLILIIPFLIFLPNWSWLFFTFLIQFSYISQFNLENLNIPNWIWLFQYISFFGLQLFECLDRRKIKGWFL